MLLADFHVHTTWSDGRLPLDEVVDLFGRTGHDVIAITDHVVDPAGLLGYAAHRLRLTLTESTFADYLTEIDWAAKRAWDRYRMIVLPGAELTRNQISADRSMHALAVSLSEFVSPAGGVTDMLLAARAAGAVTVAAHPGRQSGWTTNTFHLWNRRDSMRDLLDLWEVGCRWDVFPQVSRERLPAIANSDFHDTPHLEGWKTLVDSDLTPAAVLSALRTGRGLGLRIGTGRSPADPFPPGRPASAPFLAESRTVVEGGLR